MENQIGCSDRIFYRHLLPEAIEICPARPLLSAGLLQALTNVTMDCKAHQTKKNMVRKKTESNGTNGNHHLRFPPARILRLLAGVRAAIGLAEGRNVGFEDLEQLSYRPTGTISGWFAGVRMTQLEFLLALLERVPACLRHDLLDAACRVQPALQHPKLAHDSIATSRLETLLKQRAGFTIIYGAPEHARAFLLDALGNSSRVVNSGQQSVVGVNLQAVSVWAPVPGIMQFSVTANPQQELQRRWSRIQKAEDGSLILLGHVWHRVSHLHPDIIQLAARCHVVVADEFLDPDDLVRRVPGPVHRLGVAPAREEPEWIRVAIQGG